MVVAQEIEPVVAQVLVSCCFQHMAFRCNFGSSFGRIQALFESLGGLGRLLGFGSSCKLVGVGRRWFLVGMEFW